MRFPSAERASGRVTLAADEFPGIRAEAAGAMAIPAPSGATAKATQGEEDARVRNSLLHRLAQQRKHAGLILAARRTNHLATNIIQLRLDAALHAALTYRLPAVWAMPGQLLNPNNARAAIAGSPAAHGA
jgi:hypothetical protein